MSAAEASFRRKLKYRDLLEEARTLDETRPGDEVVRRTRAILSAADELLQEGALEDRVAHPGETLLDSRVILATSDAAGRCVSHVTGNSNAYDPNELAQHFRNNPDHWDKFAWLPRRVSALPCMGGAFAPGPPVAKPPRQRRKPAKNGAAIGERSEPECLTQLQKSEEAVEMVNRVRKFIGRHYKASGSRPIDFVRLVLDPTSFGRTVENVYHVSFLVRDGFVRIDMDDESEVPYLIPVSKDNGGNTQRENKQFIFSLNMEEWKDACAAFDVREPLLKIRRSN